MVSGPDGGVIRLRRRWANWLLTLCAFGFFIVPFSGIFVTGTNASPSLPQQVICSVLSVFTLWLTVRVARCALVATPEGLVVRNYTRTIKISWRQIRGFSPPAPYGRYLKAGLIIRLRNGRSVSANAFVPGPLNRRDFADDTVKRLELMLESRTSGPPEPDAAASTE